MRLSRRAFLRSAAATVALPALPSLLPRAARASTPPTRLLFFYVPNGVRMDRWRPVGEGSDFALGPTMSSLASFQDDLTVISGLANMSGFGDRPGDHARGTGSFLTCRPCNFDTIENGVSVDQVVANAVGDQTPFRSLELGVEAGGSFGICDSGYSCAYTQNISWASATTPLPKLTDPRVVFDRLFAGADAGRTAAEQERRMRYRASVLDTVTEQARTLESRLAMSDRHRLDEYLTGVREVERRMDGLTTCAPAYEVTETPSLQDVSDVMLDLAVTALECDLTRVITFMLGNAGSNLTYSFLPGVTGAHHQISHHQNLSSNLDQLTVIDAWEVARLARLLGRLRDAGLLDSTIVLFSSEISDGNRHNHDDLPVLVAGRGNGAVTPGRHLVVPDRTPIANLLLSMGQAAGAPVSSFADSTGPLAGLVA